MMAVIIKTGECNMPREKLFKDIKVIKRCKNCGVVFRPRRDVYHKLCRTCRRKVNYLNNKAWYERLSPEKKAIYWEKKYEQRRQWEKKNPMRRRVLALESYHRCKMKESNRKRKHRRTKF
jgi:hypothetical protein